MRKKIRLKVLKKTKNKIQQSKSVRGNTLTETAHPSRAP